MNTDKPVIVMCSGPSARKISKINNAYVCTVNLCSIICEYTDFWVINDACFLNFFDEKKMQSIKNLILPEYPHSVLPTGFSSSNNFPYTKVVKDLPDYISVHSFDLKKIRAKTSGESAIMWLLANGFKKFITIGMDKEGGRHKDIPGMLSNNKSIITHKSDPASRYHTSFEKIKEIILKQQGHISRLIVEDTEAIINDAIIEKIKFDEYQEIRL